MKASKKRTTWGTTIETVTSLNFVQALEKVVEGARVTKLSWNNYGIFVYHAEGFLRINLPDKNEAPAFIICTADLEATDWVVL